jgi:putative FmdB family regulatory protein
MPIYEFKCLECQQLLEILVIGSEDTQVEIKCRQCGSESLERIMSSTHFSMGPGGSAKTGPSTESRTCSGGSCTTWNLPGHQN